MQAHSETSGKTYPSWDDLVAAETNGYVVVSTTSRPGTVPAVFGPFPDKRTAQRVRNRLRRQWVREEHPAVVKTYIRLLWRA